MQKKIPMKTKMIFVAIVLLLIAITVYVGISVKSDGNTSENEAFVITQSVDA